MPAPQPAAPTIVHIGAFDLASYGDQLFPLVAGHEMRRRFPGADLLPFGPVGSTGRDGHPGSRTWALGPWTPDRADQIARRATLVLCGGGEFVQTDGDLYAPFYGIDERDAAELRMDRWFLEGLGAAEERCPVVWHAPGVPADLGDGAARVRAAVAHRALLAVRDADSRRRLEAAGVERTVHEVPDSAFLLPRVLPPQVLDRHRDALRAAGHHPPDGPVVVVQGNSTMVGLAPRLAAALAAAVPEARVVGLPISPCHDDGRFADELVEATPGRAWRVPDDTPVEGIAAALAGADCFLGVSLHGAITATAYGRPFVTLDPQGYPKLQGLADLLGTHDRLARDPESAAAAVRARLAGPTAPLDPDVPARIDAHFDRVAELCEARLASGPVEPVTWGDTATTLHLSLRRVPRPVMPAPARETPGVRRPDVEPSADDLRETVAAALAARSAQRGEHTETVSELLRLRAENTDLRGAMDHLQGRGDDLRERLDRSEAARGAAEATIAAARTSRTFRVTGRPAALRDRP